MGKIELPMNFNPPLKCYLWELHILGMVFTQDYEVCKPWLFNYYYDLESVPDPTGQIICFRHEMTIYDDDNPVFIPNNFILPVDALEPDLVFWVICNMLKLGYYCTGNWNEKYIPKNGSYQKKDFLHAFWIFCADTDKKIVTSIGYPSKNHVGALEVPLDDFFKGITRMEEKKVFLRFLKLNPDFNYNCFDIKKFLVEVNRYLNAPLSSKQGISAILDYIKLLLNSYEKKEEQLDLRLPDVLYEHKWLMKERLLYLIARGILSRTDLLEQYQSIVAGYEREKSLAIKYNLTKNFDIILKLVHYLEELAEKEKNILEQIMENVRTNIYKRK